jgi:hypothetical protein
MVSRGKFVIHSRAVPPLVAGDYVLEGTQAIDAGGSRPTATHNAHIRVTSARFKLPPDQILSVFPPANSEGAYEARLPQIVIKRRTLPWERALDPTDRTIPWMALVVIAEGEGQISAEAPVDQCVTAGVRLDGPNDVARGIYLAVPQSTVTKVFPTKKDLPLLAHVREVDLEDTELAMGDEDGFLAVVMANRLPQYDRVVCKPVRYTACLINLEAQDKALPPPSVPLREFGAMAHVFDIRDFYATSDGGGGSPDIAVMATQAAGFTALHGAVRAPQAPTALANAASIKAPDIRKAQTATPSAGAAADWQVATKTIESVALTAASSDVAFAVRDAMKVGFRLPIEGIVLEQVYRFPILAHWSFTCDGGGSFESLMKGLDVGLLGTLQSEAAKKKRPDCAPEPGGTAPPDAPRPRPAAEVTETGHVGLAHTTRVGDQVRAWYRGPFVPSPTTREVATTPQGPSLAHASDQLRAVTPDGREDLSLAVAFEIGRLLALSRPAFVGALMKWRREQFGAERARRLARLAAESIDKLGGILKAGVVSTLGPLIGRTLVLETAAKTQTVLGPVRPPVDPGRPIDFLSDSVPDILATGLAIDVGVLTDLQRSGSTRKLDSIAVPVGGSLGDAGQFGHLKTHLNDEVQRIATDALGLGGRQPGVRAVATASEPDALDELISDASAARQREVR